MGKLLPVRIPLCAIGIRANGETFYFDIHEKRHGPHGLVAGMTGSGKSEMVQSWILSMAVQFSPRDAAFVLIDFKGTGLLLPFARLPHLAGTISDLDTNISRNLVALESELRRRKNLFDSAGVTNIRDYQKKSRSGQVQESLPYLFVVIDEYARIQGPISGFYRGSEHPVPYRPLNGRPHCPPHPEPFRGGQWGKRKQRPLPLVLEGRQPRPPSKEALGGHDDAAYLMNPGRAYVPGRQRRGL